MGFLFSSPAPPPPKFDASSVDIEALDVRCITPAFARLVGAKALAEKRAALAAERIAKAAEIDAWIAPALAAIDKAIDEHKRALMRGDTDEALVVVTMILDEPCPPLMMYGNGDRLNKYCRSEHQMCVIEVSTTDAAMSVRIAEIPPQ